LIAYVESNFLLELARQQEEYDSAAQILSLAQQTKIQLIMPALSVYEPFSTLDRHRADRNRFVDSMKPQLRELSRTRTHNETAIALQTLVPELLGIADQEVASLEAHIERLLAVSEIIPLTSHLFGEARAIKSRFGLSPQDAIVLASVINDISEQSNTRPKCFISRNSKDFDDPEIVRLLNESTCRYISNFQDGLSFMRSVLTT
jgi:predicted nucleic acid-binding protein